VLGCQGEGLSDGGRGGGGGGGGRGCYKQLAVKNGCRMIDSDVSISMSEGGREEGDEGGKKALRQKVDMWIVS